MRPTPVASRSSIPRRRPELHPAPVTDRGFLPKHPQFKLASRSAAGVKGRRGQRSALIRRFATCAEAMYEHRRDPVSFWPQVCRPLAKESRLMKQVELTCPTEGATHYSAGCRARVGLGRKIRKGEVDTPNAGTRMYRQGRRGGWTPERSGRGHAPTTCVCFAVPDAE
jgi:hypothetical protein